MMRSECPHGLVDAESTWWFGLTVDHLYENCPGRRAGLGELGRHAQDRQGAGTVDPSGTDICGWCARVWAARHRAA